MALEVDVSGLAVDVELGLGSGCQRDPIVLERAGVVGKEITDSILAAVEDAANVDRAVIGPERHHRVDVPTVGSGSMEGGL